MNYRLACSGRVDPGGLIHQVIDDALDEVELHFGRPGLLVSGAAHGVDTEWLYRALARWPRTPVMLCIPQAPYNDSIFSKLVNDGVPVRTKVAPDGTGHRGHSDAYMKRNDLIQQEADVLVAHPESNKEQLYSGTWSTIRRFRKAHKPILISPDAPSAEMRWER